jgi:hypothetical protein
MWKCDKIKWGTINQTQRIQQITNYIWTIAKFYQKRCSKCKKYYLEFCRIKWKIIQQKCWPISLPTKILTKETERIVENEQHNRNGWENADSRIQWV